MKKPTASQLLAENADLRARLEEAEQALDAIRAGEVDALVVGGPQGDRVFTLAGADRIYRTIVETMSEAALTVAFDGTILFCNQQFAGMMRLPMEAIRGQSLTRFPADPQRSAMDRLLKQAQSAPVRRRLVLTAHDGTVIHAHLAASPLQIETGNSICMVVTDLTELEASARSVAVLRKQQQDLEQSEHALRRTSEDLARSNRDLEQFAHIASHDLQEPLRQVRVFVELLRGRLGDKLDSKCAEYLEFVQEGAARMSNLVQDLLLYSRVGGVEQKHGPASCQVALTLAMTDLEGRITEAQAKITHDELPMVSADKTQLAQLFQNLIGNAIKFRRAGAPPEVHVGAQRDGRQWRLWVKDNGIGIDPQYHSKVFLLFQRLHDRQKYEGTGIGLAVCKKIVERHGGRIWIESKEGEGSTFYFTLPEDRPI